ncbi:twin-arginine translocation pathway signal [Roseibium sp. TrichSKD4]|uniref:MBL fold metallo-hydrolase n=1 Tax=Roseibium sp. TrichSKD4 TaxID=744980 RepID=UPI0001E57013|nr:MBL fold metallo-hydrolase [Roseibium sp. TrichSKD4]EFO30434.1 twin-arginine translocation pathway signal [Roseibium sp. TrichSKD4]
MRTSSSSMNRRAFLGAGAATGALLGAAGGLTLATSAQAAAPLAGKPLVGAMRRKVGDFEVTALLDGYLDVEKGLVIGYDDAEAKRLRDAAFIEGEAVRIPVNAFLINTGDKLVLGDAGTSSALGPTLGHLTEPLAAAGVTPDQIDAILITHMHPDHLFGVLDGEGNKVFPNAELLLPEADKAFWYDDAIMGGAPEQMRAFFEGARRAADAYQDRQTLFSGDSEIVSGVRPLALPGHTPGHHGFVIDSNGETLIIAGDILHMAPYQFANPDWGIAFDVDSAQATATRKKFFDQMATDRVMFAGSHAPFPGFGYVGREGNAYRFVAADWPYSL